MPYEIVKRRPGLFVILKHGKKVAEASSHAKASAYVRIATKAAGEAH